MSRKSRLLQSIAVAAIALFAGSVLWRQLQALSADQLRVALAGTPLSSIVLCLVATALSFVCLAGYERFATTRIVPGRVPLGASLRVGVLSHAISNTMGFHVLTGGAFRYRAYRALGLGVADVARVVAIVALCVAAGVVAVSATALLWMQIDTRASIGPVAIAAGALLVAGWAFARRGRHGGSNGRTIGLGTAGGLALLGLVEMTAAIGALYVFLPADAVPALAPFALLFVGAMLLGIVSHAPGGVGVFEATMLAALPTRHGAEVLVALLLFRVLYNLLPFGLAMGVLLFSSTRKLSSSGVDASRPSSRINHPVDRPASIDGPQFEGG